jgi:hypothetical protein
VGKAVTGFKRRQREVEADPDEQTERRPVTAGERWMAKAHDITVTEYRRRLREHIFVPLPRGSDIVVDPPVTVVRDEPTQS